jgi:Lhr-like helicase
MKYVTTLISFICYPSVDVMHLYGLEQAMDDIKRGDARILFCTDMAARGLDIPHLNCVINWDIPSSRTTFLHRAGRVNRVGGPTNCSVVSLGSSSHCRTIMLIIVAMLIMLHSLKIDHSVERRQE